MIRIKSKKDGFRRCGRAHPNVWVEHADDVFSAEQVVSLRADPMLQIESIGSLGPLGHRVQTQQTQQTAPQAPDPTDPTAAEETRTSGRKKG